MSKKNKFAKLCESRVEKVGKLSVTAGCTTLTCGYENQALRAKDNSILTRDSR